MLIYVCVHVCPCNILLTIKQSFQDPKGLKKTTVLIFPSEGSGKPHVVIAHRQQLINRAARL